MIEIVETDTTDGTTARFTGMMPGTTCIVMPNCDETRRKVNRDIREQLLRYDSRAYVVKMSRGDSESIRYAVFPDYLSAIAHGYQYSNSRQPIKQRPIHRLKWR